LKLPKALKNTEMEIASLLTQAGNAHHHYEQTVLNGVYDHDWSIWYAEYAIEHCLGKLLERSLSLEQLSQFLSQTNDRYEAEKPDQSWANYTAHKILNSFNC
jgi:hypothetical protein